jgi:hypothetical protein
VRSPECEVQCAVRSAKVQRVRSPVRSSLHQHSHDNSDWGPARPRLALGTRTSTQHRLHSGLRHCTREFRTSDYFRLSSRYTGPSIRFGPLSPRTERRSHVRADRG